MCGDANSCVWTESCVWIIKVQTVRHTRSVRGVLRYVILHVHGSAGGYLGMLSCMHTARPGGSEICYPACTRLVRRDFGCVILRVHGSSGGFWDMLSCVHTARPGDIWVSYPSCTWLGQGVLGYVVLRAHGLAGGISVCYFAYARLGRTQFLYVILHAHGTAEKDFCMSFFVPTGRPRHISMPLPGPIACLAHS